jgi:hypothetical protein
MARRVALSVPFVARTRDHCPWDDREGGRQFNAKDFGLIAFGDGVDMPVRE